MSSLNKAMIIGNLGADPEIRYSQNGTQFATISVATTRKNRNKETGETKEFTEWHRVNFVGRRAEVVGQYLRKGSKVYVEGRLQTRKWQDQQGVDRYTTEIIAYEMQMLDSRGQGGNNQGQQSPQQAQGQAKQQGQPQRQPQQAAQPPQAQQPQPQGGGGDFFDDDDDIPF